MLSQKVHRGSYTSYTIIQQAISIPDCDRYLPPNTPAASEAFLTGIAVSQRGEIYLAATGCRLAVRTVELHHRQKPKPPRTEAQRAAARANGAKSRGPATPEGKARSARNSVRHGLSSLHVAAELTCLYVEVRAEFVVMHEALADHFGPVTAAEALLVEEMAICRWRLMRAWYMERGVMNEEMANMHTGIENCVEGIDGALRAGASFRQLALNHARTLTLIDRYETRPSRQFDRALRRFRDLHAHPTTPPPEIPAPNEPGATTASAAIAAEPPELLLPEPETPAASPPPIADFARQDLGFYPDEQQLQVLNATARRGIINCCRQWGKPTTVAVRAVHFAFFTPGSTTIVASPSARQSAEFMRKAARLLRELRIAPRGDGTNSLSLLLPNGARIVGLPGNPDTIRGFSSVGLLLVDEASRVPDELYRALRPMVAANAKAAIWLMSTPNGR
ncbi:MAG: hypothetical protein FJW31_13880 [Acidobacteria bacterium]|nr:hypothetical protein [Acidobacteriota bacterium]